MTKLDKFANDSRKGNLVVTPVSAQGGGGGSSGGGAFIVNIKNGMFDKTWQEIHDAIIGNICLAIDEDGEGDLSSVFQTIINGAYIYSGEYRVISVTDDMYVTDSADGYPHVGVG